MTPIECEEMMEREWCRFAEIAKTAEDIILDYGHELIYDGNATYDDYIGVLSDHLESLLNDSLLSPEFKEEEAVNLESESEVRDLLPNLLDELDFGYQRHWEAGR